MQKRPAAIRVICLIAFARTGLPLVMLLVFSDVLGSLGTHQIRRELLAVLVVNAVLFIGAIIGIWLMRKWGAAVYTALIAASWLPAFVGDPVVSGSAIYLDTALAAVALFYWRQMTWGAPPHTEAGSVPFRAPWWAW